MNIKEFSINLKAQSEDFAEVLSACSTLLKYNPLAADTKKYLDERIPAYYQTKFGFGYFPQNEHLNILIDLVGEAKLKSLDLIYDKWKADSNQAVKAKHGLLANHNLIMPYKDLYGNIIALVGRSLLPAEQRQEYNISKYKNTAFHKALHLFGLYNSKKSILSNKAAIIVEGQFDCISCHARGIHNVVALGGVNLTKYQFSILNRYTNNIYLLLDNDSPGLSAADKIINRYSKFANIKKIQLPVYYKDIDQYFVQDKMQDLLIGLQ